MSREFGIVSADTFNCKPIGKFVKRYLEATPSHGFQSVTVDPFARNKRWCTWTNDLNPKTMAEYHMDAEEFLLLLAARHVQTDVAIFDPPYSPRQISECYANLGKKATKSDTQNAHFCKRIRDAMDQIIPAG